MVSRHVIEKQKITLVQAPESLHQILAGNVTHNYYMLGTTTKLSMLFQVLGILVIYIVHLKEVFFLGLGLTVTKISIKSIETRK